MPRIAKTLTKGVFQVGATSASIGSYFLDQVAQRLRGVAEGDDDPRDMPRSAGPRAASAAPAARETATSSGGDVVDLASGAPGRDDEAREPEPGVRTGRSGNGRTAQAPASRPSTAEPEIPDVAGSFAPRPGGTAVRNRPARTASTSEPKPPTAPRRISNPKAAKKVRKRQQAERAAVQAAGRPEDLEVPGAKGKGATTGSGTKAENTPKERAAAKRGKQPAPMGGARSGGAKPKAEADR